MKKEINNLKAEYDRFAKGKDPLLKIIDESELSLKMILRRRL